MKWFRLFWFRLKVRFTARHICPKHFCEKQWKEIKRCNRWVDVRRCPECEAAKALRRQRKADAKHFRKDEVELQCMKWRKVLGYKPLEAATPTEVLPVDPEPQPVPEQPTAWVEAARAQDALLGLQGQANAYNTWLLGDGINTGLLR